jgi:hypothetical protein
MGGNIAVHCSHHYPDFFTYIFSEAPAEVILHIFVPGIMLITKSPVNDRIFLINESMYAGAGKQYRYSVVLPLHH